MNATSVQKIAAYVLLTLITAGVALPMYEVVTASVQPMSALLSTGLHVWPRAWHWNNFARAWAAQPFGRYLFNSLVTNSAIVLAQLATSCLAAYAFVFVPFRGSRTVFFGAMLAMMVPLQATAIPIYLILSTLHAINTYQGLILPFVGSAFAIFFLRQGFASIPKELIAAARIDGASEWRILWSIVVPNAKPTLITIALLNFVYHYDSLFWPLIATTSTSMRVVPVGLSYFLSQEGGGNLQWNLMMAADVFTSAPVVVLFLLGQRYMVKGLTGFSVKG